ncbi:hypothetical protein BXZ70DRAFT_362722 [Cristinia sonorae]|uniref:DUF4139 domain-containing protein n=1 Tax=Cristinia sonorae TaxID=1940300 RepID=A0A8K0XNC2_9AGAR|nr:hypothetical protein BXZ70DRAFT_362722 [Cristinia sonorae]
MRSPLLHPTTTTMSAIHVVNAAEIPIQSVTIYKSDKAQISRQISLDIKLGENKIVVKNISNAVDIGSIRVSGLGGAARLADVVCVAPTTPEVAEHSIALRALLEHKRALEDERLPRNHAVNLLDNYAKSLSIGQVSPSEFTAFTQAFHLEYMNAIAEVHKIDDQLHELEAEITYETNSDTSDGVAKANITITLLSQDDCTVPLRLSYSVSNVHWNPVYDLHASTTNVDSVDLHYRAEITQSTGEHWGNTRITLSTETSPFSGVPRLRTSRIVRTQPIGETIFGRPAAVASDTEFGTSRVVTTSNHLFGDSNTTSPRADTSRSNQPGVPFSPNGGALLSSNARRTERRSDVDRSVNPQDASGGLGLFGCPMFWKSDGSKMQARQSWSPLPLLPAGATPTKYAGTSDSSIFTKSTTARSKYGYGTSRSAQQLFAGSSSSCETVVDNTEKDPTLSEGYVTAAPSSLSVSFTAQDAITIPSDGRTHIVFVAAFTCNATTSRICIPRISNTIYLHCVVENDTEHRLPSGVVSIFLDENYASSLSLKDFDLKDSFEMVLGVDMLCRMTYHVQRSSPPSASIVFDGAAKQVTKFRARTTVRNNGGITVKNLVIQDSSPSLLSVASILAALSRSNSSNPSDSAAHLLGLLMFARMSPPILLTTTSWLVFSARPAGARMVPVVDTSGSLTSFLERSCLSMLNGM